MGESGESEPGSTAQSSWLWETLWLCCRMNPTRAPSFGDTRAPAAESEQWWPCSYLAPVARCHFCKCPMPAAEKSELPALFLSRGSEKISAQGPKALSAELHPRAMTSGHGLCTSAFPHVQEKGTRPHWVPRAEVF